MLWFITEVFVGVVALVAIVILALQNRQLRRLNISYQKQMIRQQTEGIAVALSKMTEKLSIVVKEIRGK